MSTSCPVAEQALDRFFIFWAPFGEIPCINKGIVDMLSTI